MSEYYMDPVIEMWHRNDAKLRSVLENIGAERFYDFNPPDEISIDGKIFRRWDGDPLKEIYKSRVVWMYTYQSVEPINGIYPFFDVSVWFYRKKARFLCDSLHTCVSR